MIFKNTYMMTTNKRLSKYTLVCALIMSAFLTSACSSQKATFDSPELPPRYWLEDGLGINDGTDGSSTQVPPLYNPEKSFTFSDSVYLAIQQSPKLVNSAVKIDTSKLKLIDAIWAYFPEPSMTIGISPNMTQYNHDSNFKPTNYGTLAFDIGFYATFRNPVANYFNQKVQKIAVAIAIASHREVIAKTIQEIALIYLQLEAQEQIEQEHKNIIAIRKNTTAYWTKLESIDGQQGTNLGIAQQSEREAELILEEALMQTKILRTNLKVITGVNPENPLKISNDNTKNILADFNGYDLNWEDRWKSSELKFILESQLQLHDYNILLSWSEYIPDVSFAINQSPPDGQYTPTDGQDDIYTHVYLNFPIIDWGRRYRGVQTSRTLKAIAYNEQLSERTNYSTAWLQIEQRYALNDTSVKIAKTALAIEKLKYQEMKILFDNGNVELPELMLAENSLILARINHINKELAFSSLKLDWMLYANTLQEPFIGQPQKESQN